MKLYFKSEQYYLFFFIFLINLNEKYHNVVTKHRINNKNDTGSQNNFDWDNIKILHKETNYFKRIIAEMFYIKKGRKK